MSATQRNYLLFWERRLSINILQKYTQKSKGQLTVKKVKDSFINISPSFHQLPPLQSLHCRSLQNYIILLVPRQMCPTLTTTTCISCIKSTDFLIYNLWRLLELNILPLFTICVCKGLFMNNSLIRRCLFLGKFLVFQTSETIVQSI